ncbi:hypothetical protein ACHAWF_018400 [Thalassiosira exigua]
MVVAMPNLLLLMLLHAFVVDNNQQSLRWISWVKQEGSRLFIAPEEKGPGHVPDGTRRKRPRKSTKKSLAKPERTSVIVYHKPPNVITSHSSADDASLPSKSRRRTVYEDIYSMDGFIPNRPRPPGSNNANFEEATGITSKLHAIGRLDADTSGLLLLTNDGALVHRITNPNANAKLDDATQSVQKTYEAVIMGHHSLPCKKSYSTNSDDDIDGKDPYPLQQLLENGVALSAKYGGQTKPVDALSILSHPSRSTTLISITISEGKNRQIRRMFHAIGSGVMKLHRVSVGRLTLCGLPHAKNTESTEKGLEEGEWRLLTDNEIEEGLGWKCRYLHMNYDAKNGRHNYARSKRSIGRGSRSRG